MELSQLSSVILLSGRILPALLILPCFGGFRLPAPVRVALALCLAWALLPGLPPVEKVVGTWAWLAVLCRELAVGLVLAFAAQCAFDALRMAGGWMDAMAGTSRSRVPSASAGEPAGPLAELHGLLAVVIFFALDGPGYCLSALRESYLLLPLGECPDTALQGAAGQLALNLSNSSIRCAAAIALPAGAAVLIAEGLLGLLNRTAQALPVYFMGMPMRLAAVLALAGLGVERLPALWLLSG